MVRFSRPVVLEAVQRDWKVEIGMDVCVEKAWQIPVDLDEFVKSDEGVLYRPDESMRRRRTGPFPWKFGKNGPLLARAFQSDVSRRYRGQEPRGGLVGARPGFRSKWAQMANKYLRGFRFDESWDVTRDIRTPCFSCLNLPPAPPWIRRQRGVRHIESLVRDLAIVGAFVNKNQTFVYRVVFEGVPMGLDAFW